MLLAGLADDDVELLRQAANEIASEWTNREAARLLLDAATLAEIGPERATRRPVPAVTPWTRGIATPDVAPLG